ncbi:MAG: hypothetical protein JXA17_01770 [Dehalococcoidales bacterium]|nr:hypothetical protein [Dehalococcoidales bacterium]
MADTKQIKTIIEPYIRNWLSSQFTGHIFKEKTVSIGLGEHKFDAVAEDGSIIGAILCNRPKTRGGNENTGAVRKALNDISHLKLLSKNVKKLMIFTDSGYCELIRRRSVRLDAESINMVVCKLPAHLEVLLQSILNAASNEQKSNS